MQNWIIPLGAESFPSRASSGGKAAALNALLRAGFPVPPGVCITMEAFQAALRPYRARINARLAGLLADSAKNPASERDPSVFYRAAEEIQTLLADLQLPAGLLEQLLPTLGRLKSLSSAGEEAREAAPGGTAAGDEAAPTAFEDALWAVRSSAVLEDRPGFSAAGQYRTHLGVRGGPGLERAILDVWRSTYAPGALADWAAHGAEGHGADPPGMENGMAVIIQPLLDAECAGVCLTVDPVRRRPDLALVTAAWGLGAGMADGTAAADSYRVRRYDLVSEEEQIAAKPSCIRPAPSGGVAEVPVPEALRYSPCLPNEWLQRVVMFGLWAQQCLGAPQDVEFAIARGQVWILQSRPITALPAETVQQSAFAVEWENAEEPRHFWWLEEVNSRAEAVLLPAELAFVRHRTLGGQAAVEYAGSPQTRWRKYINGRVYIAVAESTLSPGDCRIRRTALLDLFERLQQQGITLWEHWGPEIKTATRRLDAFDPSGASAAQLADHLEDAMAAAQRHWMIHTFIPRQGRFAQLLESYCQLSGRSAEEAEQDLPFLLQGVETVQTKLIEALYDLAALALRIPAIAANLPGEGENSAINLLWKLVEAVPGEPSAASGPTSHPAHAPDGATLDTSPVDLTTLADGSAIADPSALFLQKYRQLMADYGGRVCLRRASGGEIELPLPWRAAPEHVLEMIALYLPLARQAGASSPRETRERAQRDFQARVDTLCAAAPDPALAAEFRRRLDYARRNATFTDVHNHYIDQLAEGQYCQALLYAGHCLAACGDLTHPQDVFWLEPEEVLAALRGAPPPAQQAAQTGAQTGGLPSAVPVGFAALIAARREQFAAWSHLHPPRTLGLPAAALPERPPSTAPGAAPAQPAPTGTTLTGQSASQGRAAGRARIIPESAPLPEIAPGDVLIAANAGPQWTPVFPILAAIVLDGGSPGQHAAITAREFGIPAVFATLHATRAIPEGAWVTVDGEQGTVAWEA